MKNNKAKQTSKVALFLILCLMPLSAVADSGYWSDVAGKIAFVLTDAEKIYREGDSDRAKKAVMHAYFGIFESSKMEAAMRKTVGAQHTYQVERKFGDMRKAIKKKASEEELHKIAEELRTALINDAKQLDADGVTKQVFEVNK